MALYQNWYDQFGRKVQYGTTATTSAAILPVRAAFCRWATAVAVASEVQGATGKPTVKRLPDGRWEVLYWTTAYTMNMSAA